VALALVVGCAQDNGRRFNPFRAVLPSTSEDDERDVGREFDRELQKVVTVIHDPVVAGFINELGQSLVSQITPQPFIYRFRVIEAPSLNAFAVPGGYIYFHSGTILAASSIDELAGVMGHEISHVKQRHYARMRKKSQIPDLLIGLAGLAAAVAADEPGLLVAAQAANVAMKLRYTREFETEADQYGSVYTVRAGYDPAAITRFFERILDQKQHDRGDIPPYLFSHPDVEDRIASVKLATESLHPTRLPDPELARALPRVQARLAELIDTHRASLSKVAPQGDGVDGATALRAAVRLVEEGRSDAALARLRAARAGSPEDPRISFRIGELLYAAGRYEEAAASYRRTVALDGSRARVFFELGRAYRDLGERHRAVFAFEQASMRAGDGSNLQRQADWEVFKISYTVVQQAGFADGGGRSRGDFPMGSQRDSFQAGDRAMAWWARIHPRFDSYTDDFVLRWSNPAGTVVQEQQVEDLPGDLIRSVIELAEGATPGVWTAELFLSDELVDRRSVTVRSR
jgi:predicted Zn-dependent protease